jgi:predicted PurR-regulated permease PerM
MENTNEQEPEQTQESKNFINFNQQYFNGGTALPNSTAILVLGIISLVFCWCYGIFGIIFGIIAVVLSKKSYEAYNSNPSIYTQASLSNLKAGKICGIIGLILGSMILLAVVLVIVYTISKKI